MCGIVGFWDQRRATEQERFSATLTAMRDTLVHRGPDGSGLWVDSALGIGLAHRRLAILDLSSHGTQPMHSASGRFVISFNGEIYNHLEIKKLLEASGNAPNWHGHSDTEIMLAAFEAFGVEQALTHFVGMFAIALWDNTERLLYLIRDRIGEKPLYYGWADKHLIFGSELKALKQHFAFHSQIEEQAVALLMQYNSIPAPYTIYKGLYKVMPGHMLVVSQDQCIQDIAYWQLKNFITNKTLEIAPNIAVENLENLLKQTISQQMLADVPVGAFLSGGIDSSSVVALMQAQSRQPIKTFTIGFDDPSYNEAIYAKDIAKHLGTIHTELYLSPSTVQNVIPNLVDFYDEPFADSSQLPTYFVAKLTREHVTVSLSGDGGDELFAGYTRYIWTTKIWRIISMLPNPLRSLLQKIIVNVAPQKWDNIFSVLNKFLPLKYKQRNAGDKLYKFAEICTAESIEKLYYYFLWQWHVEIDTPLLPDYKKVLNNTDFTSAMMYMDSMRYLPDDILVKVDRAAMAVSLETRVPFLDHRILEYVWSLPIELKMRNTQTKWILRQILNKYVPSELYDRPKMGFGVPIHQWLRGNLCTWADDLLTKSMLNKHSLLDPKIVQKRWQDHKSGVANWQHHLWTVLMFQSWYEANYA